MEILADIGELVEHGESEKERATPEKVFALALYNKEKRQSYKNRKKDSAKGV